MAALTCMTCERCGWELPSLERLANHTRFWCEQRSEAASDVDSESECDEASLNLARLALAPRCARATRVKLVHSALELELEQQSVWGECDTGGALWFSELVLAEWLARRAKTSSVAAADDDGGGVGHDDDPLPTRSLPPLPPTRGQRTVLELGCGAAPVAGMVAFSLGAHVVLSDQSKLLPSARRNLELNHARLAANAALDPRRSHQRERQRERQREERETDTVLTLLAPLDDACRAPEMFPPTCV